MSKIAEFIENLRSEILESQWFKTTYGDRPLAEDIPIEIEVDWRCPLCRIEKTFPGSVRFHGNLSADVKLWCDGCKKQWVLWITGEQSCC